VETPDHNQLGLIFILLAEIIFNSLMLRLYALFTIAEFFPKFINMRQVVTRVRAALLIHPPSHYHPSACTQAARPQTSEEILD